MAPTYELGQASVILSDVNGSLYECVSCDFWDESTVVCISQTVLHIYFKVGTVMQIYDSILHALDICKCVVDKGDVAFVKLKE